MFRTHEKKEREVFVIRVLVIANPSTSITRQMYAENAVNFSNNYPTKGQL